MKIALTVMDLFCFTQFSMSTCAPCGCGLGFCCTLKLMARTFVAPYLFLPKTHMTFWKFVAILSASSCAAYDCM